MNLDVIINYKEFVEWLKAGNDVPYTISIPIPDSHVHGDTPSTCEVAECWGFDFDPKIWTLKQVEVGVC